MTKRLMKEKLAFRSALTVVAILSVLQIMVIVGMGKYSVEVMGPLLISVVLSGVVVFWVVRWLADRIQTVVEVSECIAQGDRYEMPAGGGSDEIGRLCGALHQISELIQLRDRDHGELLESEEKFRALFESSSDAVMLIGDNGFVDCNTSALGIFGCETRADIINKQPVAFSTELQANGEDSGKQAAKVIANAMQEGSSRFEWMCCKKDGTPFPAEIVLTVVELKGQKLLQGVVRDISERKQAEEALCQAKEETELINRNLEESVKYAVLMTEQAVEASKAKTQFLANMSHEIRTPMNGVMGIAELLNKTDLTTQQQSYVQTICDSSETLLEIINKTLDFSKIEAGSLDLDHVEFDLCQTIEEVAGLMVSRASEKGLELLVNYHVDAPHCFIGDPTRMRQVVTNLVSNAIKFTHEGHVRISVKCESQKDGKAMLAITVDDTGIGIPSDKLDTIFEKFTQADESMTRKFGGTGLGLAISRKLIEIMGGKMHVESMLGRGSTFRLDVELECDVDASEIISPYLEIIEGLEVLVVDDYEARRQLFSEMLGGWGMNVSCVSDISKCLQLMHHSVERGFGFDMVIIDTGSSANSSFEMAERILSEKRLTDQLIMVVDSLGKGNPIERCESLGIKGVLVKPIRQQDTIYSILAALGKTPVATEMGTSRGGVGQDIPDGLSVLLVEDNPVNQIVAAEIIESFGYSVDVANNGVEALAAVKINSYDIVFMDIQMPEMGGFEATGNIRNMNNQPDQQTGHDVPIIAMTAHAMKGDYARCIDAGMDDYVSKPVSVERIRAAICRVCGLSANENQENQLSLEAADNISDEFEIQKCRSDASVIDYGKLLQRCLGKPMVVGRILEMFKKIVPESLEKIDIAVANNDLDEAARYASKIKRAAENIFAEPLRCVAQELEARARLGAFGDVSESLAELGKEIVRCTDLMPQVMAESYELPLGTE